eukprot:2256729-Pleurochrysis_carterae.AAC.1
MAASPASAGQSGLAETDQGREAPLQASAGFVDGQESSRSRRQGDGFPPSSGDGGDRAALSQAAAANAMRQAPTAQVDIAPNATATS